MKIVISTVPTEDIEKKYYQRTAICTELAGPHITDYIDVFRRFLLVSGFSEKAVNDYFEEI